MTFEHVPVLFNEVIDSLNIKANGTYMDGTVGGAGHSSGICEKLSADGHLVAVDRDSVALETAMERLSKFSCKKTFIHANYSDIDKIRDEIGKVDGILLDLGVSSYQLDTAERGFSYMHDAPMDMRMNEDDMFTAATVVNEYSEAELFRIIKDYGEERWASRIAKFIVKARDEKYIVKDAFNKRVNPCTCPPELPVCVCGKVADVRKVTRKPLIASKQELDSNPRARSAKLRVIEKI